MVEHGIERPVDILLVEDNPGDVRLTREAFKEADVDTTLHVVTDGDAALQFLFGSGSYEDVPRPSLVLLDLNLPRRNGLEVLEEMENHDGLARIPVVILTSSDAEDDVVDSYEHCSNAYLTKPVDPAEFVDLIRSFEKFWLEAVHLPPTP